MSCPAPETLLLALLGPLPPADRSSLTAHLAACEPCRARFQSWRTLGTGAVPAIEKPPRGGDCPEPLGVASLATDSRSATARSLAAHVVSCAHCMHVLDEAVRGVRRALQAPDRAAPARASFSRTRIAAAGLILATAALVVWWVVGAGR